MQNMINEKTKKEIHCLDPCLMKFWCNDKCALNMSNKLGKCQFLEETEKFLYVLNILHTKHVCLADVLTQI